MTPLIVFTIGHSTRTIEDFIHLLKAHGIQRVIDVRAILQQGHRELSPEDLPDLLLPRKGPFGLVDYEKAFCPDPRAGDVFDLRGIDREAGCLVLVRPDQYVAHVLPLDATGDLSAFLERSMRVR